MRHPPAIPIATVILLAILVVVSAISFVRLGARTNVYEKVQSFSCRISEHSGDLQLTWTDEPPNTLNGTINEGSNSISANFGPITDFGGTAAIQNVVVSTDEGLRLKINDTIVPLTRLVVTDLRDGPRQWRPATQQEIESIVADIRKNTSACLKRSYNNLELNREL